MKEEDIRNRVRNKVRKLLNEGVFDDDEEEEDEHSQKVDKRKGIELDDEDDKMILFDSFVEGLVNSLKDYDVSSLGRDKLSDAIKSQSLKRMFQADNKDEYYNYKGRLQGASDIAGEVMNRIQNNEEEPEPKPVFVDYDNVAYDDQFSDDSRSHNKLMNMVYEYKKKKNEEGDEGLEEFFWDKPDRLKEKIKRIGENMSMGKIREYCGGDHGIPDGVSKEDVMNEFRDKVRDKVREYFKDSMSQESDQGILEDFE